MGEKPKARSDGGSRTADRGQKYESPGILTSSLLELKALDMRRKEPAYFELPA